MLMILSENWTLTSGRDLPELIRWAQVAEDTGFDAVMISEHVVLGPDASVNGVMGNPRDYAMPGNQDPEMPWPNSLLLLAAMASVTTRLRLVAGAIIAPLRHPLLLARELGTLDLISGGRLVVQPTVSWSKDEYTALGVDFHKRGKILDEQLEIMEMAWQGSPISYAGEHFQFDDISLAPRAYRPDGPRMWIGGQGVRPPLLRRLLRYGHGFHPVGQWSADDLTKIADGMAAAGRDIDELELVGGTRAVFPDDDSVADLGQAMEPIREQIEQGFTTFCVKPSQFIDDAADLPAFCRDVVRRVEAMVA
jgi:probable F420-dependent oxidoreductase